MPTHPSRTSFKLPTVEVIKHWAQAIQSNTPWNDFVIGVMKDEAFTAANEHYFNPPDGMSNPLAYEKSLGWAKMEFPDKSEDHQTNQARCYLYSNKLLQKLNNLRSRDHFKKDGKALDRPDGLEDRWGVSKTRGRVAIDWDNLLTLFADKDFNDQ